MANKALAKRQKMVIRTEPSQKALKARNPVALSAKQRVATQPSATTAPALPLYQRLLKKAAGKAGEDQSE